MTITELQQYVDTQDNSLRFEFQRMYEDFTHEVTHILNDYEDYLTGRIGSIHEEVWEGVDSTLSTTSTAPVQNKVITNALNEKAALSHTHDNRYYTETEINNLLNSKVNIEEGKGLSANNYTDTDKATVAQARNLILNSGSPVTGVKGDAEPSYRVGDINITKANIGLGNVNNTSDVDKPISTAVQTALNNKVDKVSGKGLSTNDFTNAYKQQLDTLDSTYGIQLDEILSTGSQNPVKNRTITNALNLKAPLSSPALTGIPTAPTATVGTNTTQIATTAFVQTAITNNAITIDIDDALSNNSSNPVENQVITAALNSKAPLNNAVLTGTPTAPTAAAGTNTTQIATTGFVNAAISSKIESFEIQYQVTDPNDIYTAYTNHKFIYCFYQNRYYTLQYCSRVSLNVIIRLAAIESNHIYFIDISRIYDNNNEYYDETWNSSNILLIDANTPTVYGYPSYSGFSVSTPDPVSDGQFVTKRYVDSRIAQTEAVIPVTTYRTGNFNLNPNNDAWFNAITQGNTVILDITMYQLGLATTEENDYIHLINSKADSYTFTGSVFDINEYYPIACTLKYINGTSYKWDLQIRDLMDYEILKQDIAYAESRYCLIHPLGYPILTITNWDTSRIDCDFCTGKVIDYGGNGLSWENGHLNSPSANMYNSWAPVADYPLVGVNISWYTTIDNNYWGTTGAWWHPISSVNFNNCLSNNNNNNLVTFYSGKAWCRNCTFDSANDIYEFETNAGIYFRIYKAINNYGQMDVYFDIVVPKGTNTPFTITPLDNYGYTIPEHYNKVPTLTIGNTTINESQLQQLLQLI